MSAPKRTPRERLVDLFDFASLSPPMGRSNSYGDAVLAFRREARRLLRAHERDLAEAAYRGAYDEVAATKRRKKCEVAEAAAAGAHSAVLYPSAILQRSATPKRGRR